MAKKTRSPASFFSYVQLNDKHDSGRLTKLRERLEKEVEVHTGEPFPIFQDRNDISWGQAWKERIEDAIDSSTFLIVIVTPSYLKSPACRKEFDLFLKREKKLRRNDLILPLIYIETPAIIKKEGKEKNPIACEIAKRQWADWRDLRFEPWTSPEVGKRLATLAMTIRDAIYSSSNLSIYPKGKRKGGKRQTRIDIFEKSHRLLLEDKQIAPISKSHEDEIPLRHTAYVEPTTLIVDSIPSSGNFKTITEAINKAQAGYRLIIRPGIYRESVIIQKPPEIIGDGNMEVIVIESKGRNALFFNTGFGRVANLTIRLNEGGDSSAVDIAQGKFELEGCDISSQSWGCVAIHGGADPRLRRNQIHGSERNGIIVYENGKGTIEDNDIYENSFSCVMIKGDGDPVLRRNRIRLGKVSGVFVAMDGKGTLEENEIYRNVFSGVSIAKDGNPILRRNRISHNGRYGIWIGKGAGGIFESNTLTSNDVSPWRIDEKNPDRIVRKDNIE